MMRRAGSVAAREGASLFASSSNGRSSSTVCDGHLLAFGVGRAMFDRAEVEIGSRASHFIVSSGCKPGLLGKCGQCSSFQPSFTSLCDFKSTPRGIIRRQRMLETLVIDNGEPYRCHVDSKLLAELHVVR